MHKTQFRICIALAILLVSYRTASAGTIAINGLTDLASQPHDHGWHRFRVTGTFLAPTLCYPNWWQYQYSHCYGVEAWCNGALEPAQIIEKTDSWIDFEIPERPSGDAHFPDSGSTCVFKVKAGDGASAFTNILQLHSPPIEIHSTTDLGLQLNQHRYRISGYLPAGASYMTQVTCDGRPSPATTCSAATCGTWTTSTTPDELEIRFPEPRVAASCRFTIVRNDLAGTPPWYQRVNGSKAGSLPSFIGVYHWGGFEPDAGNRLDSLGTSIRRIHDAGVTGPIRLAITPKQRANPGPVEDVYDDVSEVNYGTSPVSACANANPPLWTPTSESTWNPDTDYLPHAICSARFQSGLNEVSHQGTVVLTVLDSTSGGQYGYDSRFIVPRWMLSSGPNYDKVVSEYYRLAKALLISQAGTGKTFIIANWEVDNMIFCGNAYEFSRLFLFGADDRDASGNPVTDPSGNPIHLPAGTDMPTWCPLVPQDQLPPGAPPAGLPSYVARRNALINWFKARKEGIAVARAAFPGAGVGVWDGIEFAALRMMQGAQVGGKSLAGFDGLHGIVPAVMPSYALYSSWETTGNGRIDQDYAEIARYLYSLNPASPIKWGIGEFGRGNQGRFSFADSIHGLDNWILRENIRALRRVFYRTQGPGMSPMLFATIWKAFSSGDDTDYLLGVEGDETNAMRAVTVGAAPLTNQVDLAMQIGAVREIGPDQWSPICQAMPRQPRPNWPAMPTMRVFELYGNFADHTNYEAYAMCSTDGQSLDSVNDTWKLLPITTSPGQINVWIPEPSWLRPSPNPPTSPEVWCVFRLHNKVTGKDSPDFGPVLSWSVGGCNPVAL